ncbi:MAG: hypothetical protein KJZ62_00760 [Fimbriimonadaceae bacterium]|nr:hypothetical protein [Fimbriimonadaceae bacterium]
MIHSILLLVSSPTLGPKPASSDWVEIEQTHSTTSQLEYIYQTQNLTGQTVNWAWSFAVQCHWNVQGSQQANPPSWASFVNPLRNDSWWVSYSGVVENVPDQWYVVYGVSWTLETGSQTWRNGGVDPPVDYNRTLDKKTAQQNDLFAIKSKTSLVQQ